MTYPETEHTPQALTNVRTYVVRGFPGQVLLLAPGVEALPLPAHDPSDPEAAEYEASALAEHASVWKALAETIQEEDMASRIAARFDWVRFLPEDSQQRFIDEMRDVLQEGLDSGDPEHFFQFVIEWKHTAEVYADPETLAALTTDPDPNGDPDADPGL